jgi:hypothetical protein
MKEMGKITPVATMDMGISSSNLKCMHRTVTSIVAAITETVTRSRRSDANIFVG